MTCHFEQYACSAEEPPLAYLESLAPTTIANIVTDLIAATHDHAFWDEIEQDETSLKILHWLHAYLSAKFPSYSMQKAFIDALHSSYACYETRQHDQHLYHSSTGGEPLFLLIQPRTLVELANDLIYDGYHVDSDDIDLMVALYRSLCKVSENVASSFAHE